MQFLSEETESICKERGINTTLEKEICPAFPSKLEQNLHLLFRWGIQQIPLGEVANLSIREFLKFRKTLKHAFFQIRHAK